MGGYPTKESIRSGMCEACPPRIHGHKRAGAGGVQAGPARPCCQPWAAHELSVAINCQLPKEPQQSYQPQLHFLQMLPESKAGAQQRHSRHLTCCSTVWPLLALLEVPSSLCITPAAYTDQQTARLTG